MTTGIDITTFLQDPDNGIKMLIADFRQQMQRRGVNENALEGMTIALNIAFWLGENSAAQKIAKEHK